jgi:hypothetical protein
MTVAEGAERALASKHDRVIVVTAPAKRLL